MSEEEKKDQGFRVSDRRRFTVAEDGAPAEEGKAKEEEKAAQEEGKQPEPKEESPPEQAEAAGQAKEAEKKEPASLPEIDFATFVVSLSTSVLIHLGVVADPVSSEQKKDLALAKQTIDMLGMLQEKTRGNLTKEEGQLLESMLYDLRMRYVAESK